MIYPNILRRYLATLVDVTVLWSGVYAAIQVPEIAAAAWAMPVITIALVMLYEPLLTTYLCTAGQALMGIRVRTCTSLERIQLHKAYSRFFTKYVLGAISLLTIPAREDRRAIHDLLTDTIVVNARDVIPDSATQPRDA